MDRSIPAAITGVFLVIVLVLMWRGWLKRSRRDSALKAGYPMPSDVGIVLAGADAYYVATTVRDAPLERLAIPGLGFRARAALSVTEIGIILDLDGNPAVFVPAAAIDSVGAARVAIDRVVETDGLVRLGWRLSSPSGGASIDTPVDSYFRIIEPNDRGRLVDAIHSLTDTDNGSAAKPATGSAIAPAPTDESEA